MLKNRYDELMDCVCPRCGFCGCIKDGKPLHVNDFIPKDGYVTADEFSEWVMLADDIGPDSSPKYRSKWKAGVKAAFIKYMGAESVRAQDLQWSSVQLADKET